MKERVLVLGANGFIGFHLVNELISNKIPVTALVKNNSPTKCLKKIGCYNIINTNHFDCISFFIRPPSIDVLKERLIDRNDMSLEEVDRRIIEAKNEIMKSIHFDHLIVNEDFEECYKEVEKILASF